MRLAVRSSHRRRGWRLTATGGRIPCAPIGWPARLLPAVVGLTAGPGASKRKQHHFAARRRPIAIHALPAALVTVASADSRSFGWAGIVTWGAAGQNPNAGWHSCCVIAWRLWNAPSDFVQVLKRRQLRRCAQTGDRLWKTAEVDHRMPLFQVWRERREAPWPTLLGFWGTPNLQVINRDVHVAKCAQEAKYRVQQSLSKASATLRNER